MKAEKRRTAPNKRMVAAVVRALRKAGKLNVMDLKAKVPSITSEQLKLMKRDRIIRLVGNGWVVDADIARDKES